MVFGEFRSVGGISIKAKDDRVFVPEWCVTQGGFFEVIMVLLG